jgi:hypothetical protein
MKIATLMMFGTILFTVSSKTFAEVNMVAKVVIMKGQVKAKLADGSVVDVKPDQSLPEGAVLQTSEKSFVKLIFIDKSQMNLGPNSQMIINAFPKKEAGIITLVKGQIRSQVTKDYMEMDDKSKSKLYIKTKTAAMGIRGTDFQVNFNPENQNTSLITFEGKVAMAHIERGNREERFDQSKLERVVSSDKAVMVEHGQISAVNLNVAERAMVPTQLGVKQLDALASNETGVKESTDSDKKQYRNPIPPGADSAAFSNVGEKEITADKSSAKDPNGFFNNKTGEYKLPAGSIVDLSTVNIIPPPANAVFDPNTKTYVVPESFGKIDKSTGEYKSPEGLKLGSDGKFVLVDADAFSKSQAVNKEEKKDEKKEEKKEDKKDEKKEDAKTASAPTSDGRAPASVEGGAPVADKAPAAATAAAAPAPAPAPMPVNIPQPLAARPEMVAFVKTFAPTSPMLPPPPPPTVCTRCVIDSNTQKRDAAIDLGTTVPASTRVKFIFNVQP